MGDSCQLRYFCQTANQINAIWLDFICVCMYIYVCVYIYTHINIFNTYTYMYMCIYTYTHIYKLSQQVKIYVYVCLHAYINTYILEVDSPVQVKHSCSPGKHHERPWRQNHPAETLSKARLVEIVWVSKCLLF